MPTRTRKVQAYGIVESPLYNIRSKRRLAHVLHWDDTPMALVAYSKRQENYKRYLDKRKPEKPRLVEAPQERLKIIQKRIESLLKRIKIPDFVHSGVPGRSYLSNSEAHRSARGCTITLDISHFFQSVTEERVVRMFIRFFDCPRDIAEVLARLVCCDGHLATGSPASPLLSYFANQDVFDRLAKRAKMLGATFTLYMDDVAITGKGVGHSDIHWVARRLSRVGLEIQQKKTRLFHASKPKLITGRVLCDGESRAPNRQHQKMKQAISASQEQPADRQLRSSAVGRVRHVALLDEKRREKLKGIARKI